MKPFKTRAQHVADDLRERILRGEFEGGTQLRQDGLAEDYQVSRIPVREALLTLESEGLVEFLPHRGAFTTELSSATIRELFDLRVMLEGYVFKRSIPHMTAADFKLASSTLSEYDEALKTGSRIDDWSRYNWAFHQTLYRAAALPESMVIISQLNTKADRYIRMQLLYTREIEKAVKEHHQLLDLAKAGDVDSAVAALETHIREACEGIVAVLESTAA